MDIRTFSLLPDRETIDDKGHKKWFYYWKCKKFYASIIKHMEEKRPGVKIILHHRRDGEHARFNDEHYELWHPDHVTPMYTDEHTKLHMIGQKHSKEWCENISNSLKGKFVGVKRKPLSNETRKKISEKLKGKKRVKWSEESRKNHEKTMFGRIVSKETREKISKSNKGKKRSKDFCERMSIFAKRPLNLERLINMNKNHPRYKK